MDACDGARPDDHGRCGLPGPRAPGSGHDADRGRARLRVAGTFPGDATEAAYGGAALLVATYVGLMALGTAVLLTMLTMW